MDPIDQTIEALILSGAVEIVGIDSKTGEPLYSFNEKIKEIMPEVYQEHLNLVNNDIMTLWEKGFLDIDLLSEDPFVSLTEKAFIQAELESIPTELSRSLDEIKRLLFK